MWRSELEEGLQGVALGFGGLRISADGGWAALLSVDGRSGWGHGGSVVVAGLARGGGVVVSLLGPDVWCGLESGCSDEGWLRR